jgi:hypothetical protein
VRKRAIIVFTILVLALFALSTAHAAVIGLEQNVPDAIGVRIPNSGFDFITDLAETLINAIDINTMVMAMNPILPYTCEVIASAEGNITNLAIGDITVQVSSNQMMGMNYYADDIYLMISIPKTVGASNLLELTLDVGIPCDSNITSVVAGIDVTSIDFGVAVDFAYDSVNGVVLTIDETKVNLNNFLIQFSGLAAFLEGLFSDLIEDAITPLFSDLGQDLIQDVIDDMLQDVILEGDTAFGSDTLHFALDPMISTDSTGVSFFAPMQLYIEGTEVDSCVDPGWPVGSRFTANGLGTFGNTTPGGLPYQLAVALSDDILNQLMFSAYVKGLLCWGPEGLNGYDFENLLDKETNAALDQYKALDWKFMIYPITTPLFEVGQGGNDLSLVIEDMRFDWLVEKQGRMVELLNAKFSLNVGLDIEMDADSNLLFTFNNPTINLNIHESEFNILPIDQIEPLINTLLGFFEQMLQDLIPPVPLPGFAGFNLLIQEVAPIGNAGDYLGIYLMVEAPILAYKDGIPDTQIILNDGLHQISDDLFDLDAAQSATYALNDGRSITLQLDAVGGGDVEKFYYKLDDADWRLVRANTLTLSNLIEGEHTVAVKAKNNHNVQDDSPAIVRFVCDNIAPEIRSAQIIGNTIVLDAWDYVDGNIRFQVSTNSEQSFETSETTLALDRFDSGVTRVRIRPIDGAGNVGQPTILQIESNNDNDAEEADSDDSDDGLSYTRTSDSGGGCGF